MRLKYGLVVSSLNRFSSKEKTAVGRLGVCRDFWGSRLIFRALLGI